MMTTANLPDQRPTSSALPRRALSALFTVTLLAVVAGVAYGLEVKPWSGAVPNDAFVAGEDSNGNPLYICVASNWGGEHPGALTEDGICHVAWGGDEYTIEQDFTVVVGSGGEWVEAGDDGAPAGAFAAGNAGEPIYVCRVDGRPGKLASDGICYVAADGQEQSSTSGFQVLVQ